MVMSPEENTVLCLEENERKEWPDIAVPLHIVSTPYLYDLRNTLEFDRKCRDLEVLFEDLKNRIATLETKLQTQAFYPVLEN